MTILPFLACFLIGPAILAVIVFKPEWLEGSK